MADRGVRGAVAAALAGSLLMVAACSREQRVAPELTSAPTSSGYDRPAMRFGDHVVSLEIADDAFERQRGLMHRTRLGTDDGMLFVFTGPTNTWFWMKNTLIPLSIAFLRDRGRGRVEVVKVLDMEPCELENSSKCPRYDPGVTYDLALEVNQGWFERARVDVGDEGMYEPAT